MSEEKRRKFSLSRVLRRRQSDRKSNEVGIKLLHPVSNGGPDISDQDIILGIDRFDQLARAGNLNDLQTYLDDDPSRINAQDPRGWSALHHAAMRGFSDIISYITSHGGDINLQDRDGNTALHVAVEKEQTQCIEALIQQGADTSVLNCAKMAPVHLAIDLGLIEQLRTILLLDKSSTIMRGETGNTPLHYCAFKDRDDCAKLLLEHGAKPCLSCDDGFYPIHSAATRASDKTLEVLIKHVERLGYTRESVLSFTDKYNNTPLHSAVSSGDPEAVRVCLNAGAGLDVQQEDKSTALHFACAQGGLNIIHIMRQLQPEKFIIASQKTDILQMTPLHRAALFNHVTVVKFLIDEKVEINAVDCQKRTPLLLAASKGGWKTVQLLLESGADISCKDNKNRNFLHLAIKYGGKLNQFGVQSIKHFKNLLNEKDDYGCTPLHYASKEGYLVALDDLIELGATVNPKNKDKQSPLHFAARFGRYNTCRRLLDSKLGPNIINESDCDGLTALHLAALNGHVKIINLLMQKGACLTRAHDDNSPIHMAAINGYTKCIRALLSVHANILDVKNKHGVRQFPLDIWFMFPVSFCCETSHSLVSKVLITFSICLQDTALHIASRAGQAKVIELLLSLGAKITNNVEEKSFIDIAIENRQTSVAQTAVKHARWSEVLHTCSETYGCPMHGLIQHLPDVCMTILDRCVTNGGGDPHQKEYYTEYNYEYMQCPVRYVREAKKIGKDIQPMFALNLMVRHGRVECLSHKLCRTYLNMKWRAYGMWVHSVNLVLYLAYLSMLTLLATKDFTTSRGGSPANSTQNTTELPETKIYYMSDGYRLVTALVFLFLIINVIKEIVQMAQQRVRYFLDPNNLLEWVLYMSTAVFIAPVLFHYSDTLNMEAGAVAIFLAWFNCLLFLQRFDVFGIYVVMFLEILVTLLQALSVFSILLVAFGLAFSMLLQHEESHAYSNPLMSIVRTTMMMLELDYMSSFNDPYFDDNSSTLPYSTLTILFLLVFVLLMPILLVNLLIGLAVGDIESVLRNATLKRLAMQVEHHTELERRLPSRLLEKVDKMTSREYPNKCGKYMKVFKSFVQTETESSSICGGEEASYLKSELLKQKTRLKEMSVNMERNYDMLKLIVQKMEIETEADNHDEGFQTSQSIDAIHPSTMWNSDVLRKNLVRQNAVISKWKVNTQHTNLQNSFDC
ncbi:transient receptor potential cation channel subfamily A member 1-like isoform X2 [Ostrea edulis]|uniref:transient receptor potential cation channel subfamily A member 1-like isoform X2 n=1 Tax=Ostrea edulis TaxID=37623 RepID=UPI0024AEF58C|nr:transient receptor potential cation channel subfamily A member 1-like isoform X2 [Ostrea edulis]